MRERSCIAASAELARRLQQVGNFTAELSEGEIRKVNPDTAKLTIRHGPIQNLDMPGMTMVFQVKDASMINRVQAGDKVRFRAEKIGGKLTVTEIETVR